MTYNIKNKKTNKDISWDIGYNNSSRQFRPLGSRVIASSIKCDSLDLRTEGRRGWF